MRTLLVDNHDSFTYNVFHYVAELTGREPVVVRNDDPDWRIADLARFDRVIISPGPGNPGRRDDFGICRDIIEATDVPLLGICLGHQGLALNSGATVGPAPEPRHGRPSPVLHTGEGLYAGMPSPFTAVRYHSLAVSSLPEELEATAWTPDGVIMGLRHRTRPLVGVQFHPESIGSEHGHRLLANFLGLDHDARRRPRRLPEPHRPEPAQRKPRDLRLLVERLPTRWSDEVVYDRLYRTSRHSFWLDSSRTTGADGRFSMMGDASGPLSRTVTADIWSRTVVVKSATGTEIVTGGFLDWLEQDLRATRVEAPELPFDFALGWAGYLGYELKAECGGEAVHRSPEPDAAMVFADRAVVFDHQDAHTYLLALAEDDDESGARLWLDDTADTLARLAGEPPAPVPEPPLPGVVVGLRHDRAGYLDLIDTCLRRIDAGETYEVCLTNMAEVRASLDPWDSYRHLRRTSPSPFSSLLRLDEFSVLSTSPERFLRVGRDRVAESRPIKGTRPRGATPAEDAELVADLRASEKDRAENLMIVDLVRNDLGRCAEVGSVTVDAPFAVESYATVHQLVSTVRARVRRDSSTVQCVRAAFPGGSMTGAPKERTMQIIDGLEGGPRGVYSGAIGYFSLCGAADLSIVIRTAVVSADRVRYGVGGAITALSDPAEEFEETAVKASPLLGLVDGEFPGRSPARLGDAPGLRR
ncbi:aminodeoxychorismate synthase component I [Streptomyces sp. SID7909]|uniref:aminodeoxychorismate synthase component I n=1 Tax=Streptomyces sp. SID7909 TaxID=2706092 RepID=UPI0013BAFFAE|nr:aminodeoxychorismate synthase component I [Streptomyces sp. SID7909]NEC08212.1 aminodeoxychorismate synthase component I [Streptomyces sp. SID7909]